MMRTEQWIIIDDKMWHKNFVRIEMPRRKGNGV